MKFSSSIALATVLIAGLSAPAFAASAINDNTGIDSDYIVTQLQQRGINAVDANENWNGVVRVTVQLADGSKQFQYFYEDGLQPVSATTGTNTRVLSKLDVGTKHAPVQDLRSLADNDDGFFD